MMGLLEGIWSELGLNWERVEGVRVSETDKGGGR